MGKFFVLYLWMDLFNNKAFNFFSNIALNRRATKKSLANGRGSWVVGVGVSNVTNRELIMICMSANTN